MTMRRSIALLLSAALLAPLAWAKECPPTPQPPTPELMQQLHAQAKDRGALWKLTKEGRSSYLYGTVHIGRMEWAVPGPRLQEALRATEVLAVELDLTAPSFPGEFQQAQAQATPLTLSAEEQGRLDAQADAACLPRGALAGLHPLMQAVTYVSLSGRHDGLDPAFAQESMLLGVAQALKRPVVALESVAQQMAVLLPKDAAQARRFFLHTLTDLEKAGSLAVMRRLAQAWEQGDLAAIASPQLLCQCEPEAWELEFNRRLNDDRNPNLAERIAAEHAKGKPVLAAVGLLHMTGPKALPTLLAERGFQVERVR